MVLTEIKTGQCVDLTKVEAIKIDYAKHNEEYLVVIYIPSGKFVSSRHLEERSAVQEQCRLVGMIEDAKN